MSKSKLAAALAATAALALAPAAVADPAAPPPPAETATNTYPYQVELMKKCNMLKDMALLARDWDDVEMYLEISGEYERLHCARWTGPLPAWLG